MDSKTQTATTKKPWTTPQLIVLARGKPEERVLMACKLSPLSGTPNESDWACADLTPCDHVPCVALLPS